MKKNWIVYAVVLLTLLSLLASCQSKGVGNKEEQIVESKELTGAGATFPKVLYEKYFDTYNKEKGVQVNYQAVGSGAGINTLIEKTVDIGATDAPMNEEEEAKAGAKVLHIPTALGAVVVTYNLPGSPVLKMNADVISKIFQGNIKKWSDPMLKALNPDTQLPEKDIIVVHRSDGSGTTYTFTEYLTKADPSWADKIGKGKSINWPVGLGGKGNDGVAGLIKQTEGSIGYVELIYAFQNKYPTALIQNKSGNFIEPNLNSVSLAAKVSLPDDLKVSLTDTDFADGYPIVSFTWLLVYQEQNYAQREIGKGLATANMLWWITHEAQAMNEELLFGKLAPEVVEKAELLLKSITFDGKALLK